jgi:ectoine hydroxylase-related dioxygenase (phytanoyl-CoA dioxygenase family)
MLTPAVEVSDLCDIPAALDEHGFVVLRGVLDIDLVTAMQRRIQTLVAMRRGPGTAPPTDRAATDAMLLSLTSEDVRHRQFIYDVTRFIPELYALAGSDVVMQAMASALDTGGPYPPVAYNNVNLRMDYPGVDWSEKLPWHQDYPYRNPLYTPGRSLASWIPVFPCPAELGPVEFIPGSHHWGEISTIEVDRGPGRTSVWRIDPAKTGSMDDLVVLDAHPGDLIIFSLATVHRSGINRDPDAIRWTVQARYHDMSDGQFLTKYAVPTPG